MVHAYALRELGRWTDLAVVCAAVLAAVAFWPTSSHAAILDWLGCIAFIGALRCALSWRSKTEIESPAAAARWQDLFLMLTVLLGVTWGTAGWFMFEPGSLQRPVTLIVLFMVMGALPGTVLAGHLRFYLAYLLMLFMPLDVRLMLEPGWPGTLLALTSIGAMTALYLVGKSEHEKARDDMHLRLSTEGITLELGNEINERTRLERHLRREEEQVRHKDSLLFELTRDPSIATGDLRAALRVISTRSTEATRCARISVWFMNSIGTTMRCAHVYDLGQHTAESHVCIEQDDCPGFFEALHQSRAVPISDLAGEARLAKIWQRYFKPWNVTAVLCIPFRHGHKVRGVVFHEWSGGHRDWTPGEMTYAGAVADYMTLALATADRREAEEEMRKLANYDRLTGLPNRNLFQDRMEQALARARRSKHSLALLFIDVDRFKSVNDSLGHNVGDQLLYQIGHRLLECVRSTDTIARLGGDEFTVILEDCADMQVVTRTCERILESLAEPLLIDGTEISLGCSIGVSLYPSDGHSAQSLLQNADSAMYKAKERGRNNFQFFTQDMHTRAMQRLSGENALRKAIRQSELVLHYQPQFDVRRGGIVGVEALVRWENPDLGLIPPSEFIALAEETGLIVPLGQWVITEACRQASIWHKALNGRGPHVAVNLSVRQFALQNLLKMVEDAIKTAGLPANVLQFEITETLLMQDVKNSRRVLEELKGLGVQIAVDDFGTGHSSLNYIKYLPVDVIKVDRTFVKEISANKYDAAIAHCIIKLARRLKLGVVAEGVETPEQMRRLVKEGCHVMQGYLFSEPLPAAECDRLLQGRPDFEV